MHESNDCANINHFEPEINKKNLRSKRICSNVDRDNEKTDEFFFLFFNL